MSLSSKKRRSILLFSPNNLSVRRSVLVEDVIDGGGPPLNTSAVQVPLNDDDAEKYRRKQDKVLEMHQQSSPIRTSRRQSMLQLQSNTIGGLTSAQLAEQYSDCIRLSTENKITMKNAFGLHLIDYMALMLKEKDSEMNNLPVASLTLDASTKIYGYRVDCIHADTFKMVTGLSRSSKRRSNSAEEDDAEVNKAKKKKVKSRTIEQNIKALDMNKFDLQFEVDPLFRKTTEMFSETGSSGGYLLHLLRSRDDGCELLFDSAALLDCPSVEVDVPRSNVTDLSDIKSLFDETKFEALKICPVFSTFEFGTRNTDGDLGKSWSMAGNENVDSRDIEVDDRAEEIANDSGGNLDDSGDGNFDDGIGDAPMENPVISIQPPLVVIPESPIEKFDAVNLIQVLASEPSEYSYFDERLLSAWAGPHHWRPLPRSKDTKSETVVKEPKPRTKKVASKIDYESEANFKKHFKNPKSDIQLSKSTIKQWSEDGTTLPQDLHYKANRLMQLFLKPSNMVQCRKRTENNDNDSDDEAVNEYDYNNPNDVEHFVPPLQVPDGALSPSMTHFNDMTSVLQPSLLDSEPRVQAAFTGENLVPEPRKVAKFVIPYAHAAKKINVRRLKTSMWTLLCPSAEKDVSDNLNKDKETDVPTLLTVEKNFRELYDELHHSLTAKMAADLSEHIAFVCLLHLANEKNLKLISQQDLKDFRICQSQDPLDI